MYRIDFSERRILISKIEEHLHAKAVLENQEIREKTEIYAREILRSLLVVTVKVLNDKTPDMEYYEKVDKHLRDYETFEVIGFFMEFFYDFICRVKTKFIHDGHDDRLFYRLEEKEIDQSISLYAIVMDLDKTHRELLFVEPEPEPVNYSEYVSDVPSQELLEGFLNGEGKY